MITLNNKPTRRAFFYWLRFAYRNDHSQWVEMLKEVILGTLVVFAGLVILVWAVLRLTLEPVLVLIRPFYYAAFCVADLEIVDAVIGKKKRGM